jgi:hypothetical protein
MAQTIGSVFCLIFSICCNHIYLTNGRWDYWSLTLYLLLMKKLIIKLLVLIILSSFTGEAALFVIDKSVTEISATTDKEDSEQNTEEEKAEKETEKDKTNYSYRQRLQNVIKLKHTGLHLYITTSAYLSLPEIPPDQI